MVWISFSLVLTCSFENTLSLNLELTDLAMLATQQSLGTVLPLFLQGSDHRQVLPLLGLKHVLIYT